MVVKQFEDLDSWRKAREVTKTIYQVTQKGGFLQDRSLQDQMRRAAISIQSNIAEAFERNSRKEYIHFLSIAKASCGELRSQVYTALDLSYLSKAEFQELFEDLDHLARMLFNHIAYLKKTEAKK